MSEPEVTAETTQEQPDLHSYLKKLPNAPTKEQIEKWKTEHGDIFVWRPLTRKEHRQLQILLRQEDPAQAIDQFTYEEMVCDACVLWAGCPKDWNRRAGLATTLSEQIFQNSYFLPPSTASMMVMRL